MGSTQAARTVFVAGALLLILTLAQRRQSVGSLYPKVFAIGVLTMALAVAADWAPQVIVPLSAAIVVGYAIRNPGAFRFLIAPGEQAQPSQSSAHDSRGIGGRY